MCGILGIIRKSKEYPSIETIKNMSSMMKHRGPDEHDFQINKEGRILTHERLSIIDLHTGKQPIRGTNEAYVVHNGEIYNHQVLRENELKKHFFHTTCDSEVIVHLYEEYGYDFCNKLDGVFAFIIMDKEKFMVARDPIGIKPLYYGSLEDGSLCFASEMKAITTICKDVKNFPPGHYYTAETGFVKYFQPDWNQVKNCCEVLDLKKLRETLIKAIEKRLMSDVPLGVLLSGGLDSSLTSAIAARLMKARGQKLHSFSIGLDENSPDLIAAKKVADFLGTAHHNIHFTVEKGLAIINKLIWHLETYDVTSIRASTPMYLLSKYITNMGIKVVLSGEGADEIFGGYLYFYHAPSLDSFQKETIRRVNLLSTADCLRADKSAMANGLETRVPFLDKVFLQVAMKMAPQHKKPVKGVRMEKQILREAFDEDEDPWLPKEILWRQKEQFSDGVGYQWIDKLISYATDQVSDEQMEKAAILFPYNTPKTKEAFYMRSIFEQHFPGEAAAKTVVKWIPKWQKNTDPSGRANTVHEQALKKVMI